MPKDPVERELRTLRAENNSLKKQISRYRKRLQRIAPEEVEEEEEVVAKEKEAAEPDEDKCPSCAAPLAILVTPGKSRLAYCKNKCGYRRKAT